MDPILSIIIVNYNTRQLVQECIDSIYRWLPETSKEIIVVDNNSSDGSVEMIDTRFPEVIVVQNDQNKGFAAANNQAVTIARGDLILLLNSDTVLIDSSVQNSIEYLLTSHTVEIIGCKLLNRDHTLQPSCRSFPRLWNIFVEASFLYTLFPQSRLFGSYHMTHFAYDRVINVDVVMGAFMLIRRSVIERIGLFDESFFMYAEETDFCYRAKQHGYTTQYYPHSQIIHYGGGSIRTQQEYFHQIHLAQILFIKKHFRGPYRYFCLWIKMIGLMLRIPVYAVTGIITMDQNKLRKSKMYYFVSIALLRRRNYVSA